MGGHIKSGEPDPTPTELEQRLSASEEQGRRHTARLRVLSDVTQVLADATIDYPRLVQTVVELLADRIGDSCMMRLTAEDETRLDPVACFDPDPEAFAILREAWASMSMSMTVDDLEKLTDRVVSTRKPVVLEKEAIDSLSGLVSAETLMLFERLGTKSVLSMPLRARGRTIGILTLMRHRSDTWPYDEEDQRLALDLGNRAALAIDNARLFARLETQVARRTRELDAAKLRIARSEAATETLAAGVAHKINNPLVYIKTNLELVSKALREGEALDASSRAELTALVDDALEGAERVRKIVAEMKRFSRGREEHALGGSTEVESGTTGRVRLSAGGHALFTPRGQSEESSAHTRRASILVVDDDPLVGSALRRVLARDHDIVVFMRGSDAIAELREGTLFDVIFCDLMMPEMSGMDVFAAIEALSPDMAARVVFITGGAYTPEAQRFLDEHRGPIIDKPFDISALLALIDERLAAG